MRAAQTSTSNDQGVLKIGLIVLFLITCCIVFFRPSAEVGEVSIPELGLHFPDPTPESPKERPRLPKWPAIILLAIQPDGGVSMEMTDEEHQDGGRHVPMTEQDLRRLLRESDESQKELRFIYKVEQYNEGHEQLMALVRVTCEYAPVTGCDKIIGLFDQIFDLFYGVENVGDFIDFVQSFIDSHECCRGKLQRYLDDFRAY